jgi:hypothetical protein
MAVNWWNSRRNRQLQNALVLNGGFRLDVVSTRLTARLTEGKSSWNCQHDHRQTKFLLADRWPQIDAEVTLELFRDRGGFCDPARRRGGEGYERISLTGIGPSAWKISHLPIISVVKHPPLAPTQAAIDKLKLPSTLWVKRVGHPKIMF